MRQLIILAVISLAEQTALNSVSPYLPEMVRTFPGVDKRNVGLSVGVIASSFAAAQFSSKLCLFATCVCAGGRLTGLGGPSEFLLGTIER